MLTKKLLAACKRVALGGGLAFVVAATSLTTLANPNVNSPSNGGEGNVTFNNSSPNPNPSCDNERINPGGDSNAS